MVIRGAALGFLLIGFLIVPSLLFSAESSREHDNGQAASVIPAEGKAVFRAACHGDLGEGILFY